MRPAAPAAALTSLQTCESSPSAPAREHGVEHELRQPPAGDLAGQHVLRAVPEHADDAGEDQEDRDGGQDGARAAWPRGRRRRPPRRRARSAASVGLLGREGLHHARRADRLGGEGGGVGQPVLRQAGALAHGAAGGHQRQHDDGDGEQHEGRERGLVTTIIATAPTNSTRLRSATEALAPKADLICVVSAVRRETISPDFTVS